MSLNPRLESSVCPSCGAPLALPAGATAIICRYCNCALRASPFAAQSAGVASSTLASSPVLAASIPAPTQVTVDSSISPQTVARIKQLLLLGERTDAVTLYVAEAHCDRATSEATIDAYAADDVWSTMRKGRLDAMGMAMFFGALFLLTGSVALGVTNRVSWVVAAVIAALPSLWVLLASPNALQALRYLRATAGEATVVRFAFIGKNTQSDSLFRLLVDVREPSGKTFRAEMLTVLGEAHALAMREGHRMRVKYFPGAAASLAYDGEVP